MVATELFDRVRGTIDQDNRIRSSNSIVVQEDNGKVALHGSVGNIEEFELAQKDAESIEGVRLVINHLIIRGDEDQGACCPLD